MFQKQIASGRRSGIRIQHTVSLDPPCLWAESSHGEAIRAGEAVLRQTTRSWCETGVCEMWPTFGEQIQLRVIESSLSCAFSCLVKIG